LTIIIICNDTRTGDGSTGWDAKGEKTEEKIHNIRLISKQSYLPSVHDMINVYE